MAQKPKHPNGSKKFKKAKSPNGSKGFSEG
jgi:hypothetical protein